MPTGSGNRDNMAAPNSAVVGPSGIQTTTATATTTSNTGISEVDSQFSQSPVSYHLYEMNSDSDSDKY